MKRIIATLLLIASCAFAQYNPGTENDQGHHFRRGFYFSTSTGITYTSINYFREEMTYNRLEIIKSEFSGLLTYGEARLGVSITNWPSFYGVMGFGYGSGRYSDKIENSLDHTQGTFEESGDEVFRILVGLGGEYVYPFQEIESSANGLFFGISAGFIVDFVNYTDHDTDEVFDYTTSTDFGNFFFRFETGKDWWISRRWSIGAAFNYTLSVFDQEYAGYNNYTNKESSTGHTFGLMFRITH